MAPIPGCDARATQESGCPSLLSTSGAPRQWSALVAVLGSLWISTAGDLRLRTFLPVGPMAFGYTPWPLRVRASSAHAGCVGVATPN